MSGSNSLELKKIKDVSIKMSKQKKLGIVGIVLVTLLSFFREWYFVGSIALDLGYAITFDENFYWLGLVWMASYGILLTIRNLRR